jgi:dihydroorotate dehydrogenase electron transfer subunit
MSKIVFNQKISSRYYRMRILCPEIACKAKRGEFIMVKVTHLLDPLLRRPFAIHRLCQGSDNYRQKNHPTCIEILYRIVGNGTLVLSKKSRGDEIDLIGPLGNGFYLEQNLKTAIMIAGGIGVAPLLSLAQALKRVEGKNLRRTDLIVFIGGETKEDILCVKDFEKIGAKVVISTEDGSLGTQGMVTDMFLNFLKTSSPSETHNRKLFACGPSPMLQIISEIAISQDITCQISLESRMACGVGACLGCSVPTRINKVGGNEIFYQRVCKEGPVFDSTIIMWS